MARRDSFNFDIVDFLCSSLEKKLKNKFGNFSVFSLLGGVLTCNSTLEDEFCVKFVNIKKEPVYRK